VVTACVVMQVWMIELHLRLKSGRESARNNVVYMIISAHI